MSGGTAERRVRALAAGAAGRRVNDRRRRWLVVLALLLGTSLAGLGTAPGAGAAETVADPALRSAPTGRLGRLVSQLRRSPLAVDPELDWLVGPGTRREILRALRRTDVPILVTVLPLETQDESGGDAERVLRELQRRLRRDAMYVVVDPDGQIDESAYGLDRDPEVPFELRYPPTRGTYREGSAPVNRFDSVPGRLAQLAAVVDRAPSTGTPAPGVTTVSDLSTLPSDYDYDYDDEGLPTASSGVLLALLGACVGVWIARRRIRRDTGGARTKAQRAADRRGRAGQRSSRRRGRRKRRNGR